METGGAEDAPAIALTNGHCVQPWTANDVYFNLPLESSSLTFNWFVDAPESAVDVEVRQVLYSTMKGRDLAILELASSVGELRSEGIVPLPVSSAPPALPAYVTVAGIPVSGVPAHLAYLRAETCLATGTADLFEFQWHFTDSLRTSCQDIYGGSSGSPVFTAGSEEVIGLVNTTTVGGVAPCGIGMPCEITAAGTAALENRSYVVPVSGLADCFDQSGRFEPMMENCPLDTGRQLLIANYPTQPVRPAQADVNGTMRPIQWNAQLTGDLAYYRTKMGSIADVDCAEEAGYSKPIALVNSQQVSGPVGTEDGSYLLCVVAGDTETVDESWQPVQHATVARIEIDSAAPTMRPALSVFRRDEAVSIEPIFVVPELVDFLVRVGPAGDSCADQSGYSRYRRIPITIPAERLPATVCLIASDMAGNESEPHIYPVTIAGSN